MIPCREACELHTHAAEGALHGMKKVLYEMHMTVCAPCKRYRAQLETTRAVLKGLPKEEPSESLVDRLAAELPEKKI